MSNVKRDPKSQQLVESFLTSLKGVFYRHQRGAELLTPEVTKTYVDAWTPSNGVDAITAETIAEEQKENFSSYLQSLEETAETEGVFK